MRSLLYKDLMNLKQLAKTYLFIIVIWGVIAWMQKNAGFLGGALAVFAVMFSMSSWAYDEKAGWDKYALTMQIGKKEIILSKYLLAFLALVVGIVLFGILSACMKMDIMEFLPMVAIFFALGLFMTDLVFPIIFRFGTEKGRYMMIAVFLVISLVAVFLQDVEIPAVFAGVSPEAMVIIAMVLAIVLMPLSISVSFWIYSKKEF